MSPKSPKSLKTRDVSKPGRFRTEGQLSSFMCLEEMVKVISKMLIWTASMAGLLLVQIASGDAFDFYDDALLS